MEQTDINKTHNNTNLSDQVIPNKYVLHFQVSMYDRMWLYGMQIFHSADHIVS